ncbi:MAG: cation transporter [Deltaproteobacteria bacterium]|nr:cation transporter [Deltaproteobacteria bacterium]
MMRDSTRDQMQEPANGRKLILATVLTLGFAAVEAAAGWWSGSLALLSDAGHMVTDASALLIAALAGTIARRGPSPKHSYGFGRAQLVAALANGLFMLAIVATIIVQAVSRFANPIVVHGEAVTVVASLGLLLNILVAQMLSHGGRDLNVRAALLHVLGDLLGSVAALLLGVIIWATGWFTVDPALSLLIALLIAYSSLKLVREAFHGLMEGVPLHLSLEEIGVSMATVEGATSVHDLHVWSLTAERIALSAHVVIGGLPRRPLNDASRTEVGSGYIDMADRPPDEPGVATSDTLPNETREVRHLQGIELGYVPGYGLNVVTGTFWMIPQPVEKDRCVPGKLTPDRDVGIPLPSLSIQCARVLQPDVKTSEEQLLARR